MSKGGQKHVVGGARVVAVMSAQKNVVQNSARDAESATAFL